MFGLFKKKKEIDIKGMTYDNGDGVDKTAYYFETFNGWVSIDEPIVFLNMENDNHTETPLNEWLIKVREGLGLKWWELQILEDNHMGLLKMYWGNPNK